MYIDMSHVKNGKSGNWEIDEFIVPERDFSQVISMFKTGRSVPAGTYKRLTRGNVVVMSNTPDEIRDFMHFVRRATGTVLINGLGLGVVLTQVLAKDYVSKVIVVEKSEDVINLVSGAFNDARLTIIHSDAFDYKPPKGIRFNAVWHDIWDYICTNNLPQMTKLHRKYGKIADWQDSWAKQLCESQKRKDKKYSWY